jgi:uncharacterized protein (DUF1778 family)
MGVQLHREQMEATGTAPVAQFGSVSQKDRERALSNMRSRLTKQRNPAKGGEDAKGTKLEVRLTTAEKARIEAAANLLDISMSRFVADYVLLAADEVLSRELIVVPNKSLEDIDGAKDNPKLRAFLEKMTGLKNK